MSHTVPDILEALKEASYPRVALDIVDGERERFVEPLLELLVQTAEHGLVSDAHHAHILAIILLTRARERRVHDILLELARAPEELDVLGDYTGFLPASFWHTCGGDPAKLVDFLAESDASPHCRAAAARALIFGVAYGVLKRDTVLDHLARCLIADDDPVFKVLVITCMIDLYPEEHLSTIEATFEIDELDGVYLTPDYIHELMAAGPDAMAERLAQSVEARGDVPLHALADWPMWEDPTTVRRTVGGRVSLARPTGKSRRKKKGKKR